MIYLASPYSDPSESVRIERFLAAGRAAAHIVHHLRLLVYSPILHNHLIALVLDAQGHEDIHDWDYWCKIDIAMLRLCTELRVLKLPGWELSKGVNNEIEIAKVLHMPVTYMEPV